MTVLEKIKRCVSLVWDFQEIYGEEDIEDFCHNELSTYPQHDEIMEYFKHLAELEKENEQLTVSYETLKLHDEEEIGMLKSENAELKGIKDVATLIRANNDTVVTLMQLNNMLVSKSQKLTKAKKHIKQLLDCLKQDTNDPQTNYYVCQYMDKAEQYLKEIEK